ncbi:hypothetical protein EZV62_028082 [Acer yangbiense]|uniref:Uncharacterized protein n=1 Tax=Acer yangbiense TaxID=1000413 RepID=A0A5C7GP77_9ROSI|nr:hypothetical protein EZV62_028082 [Acer yangbiense]
MLIGIDGPDVVGISAGLSGAAGVTDCETGAARAGGGVVTVGETAVVFGLGSVAMVYFGMLDALLASEELLEEYRDRCQPPSFSEL